MKISRHFLLLLFFVAAPCLGEARVTASGPEINIVTIYDGVAKFATAAKNRAKSEHGDLYSQFVGTAFKDQCFREIEPYSLANRYLTTPGTDLDGLITTIDVMKSSDMVARIVEAIGLSAKQLPIDHISVCITPFPPGSRNADWLREKFNGVMGFSEARGIIWITPLPTDKWLDMLPYVVAHEYHHAVAAFTRAQPVQQHMSLLESMLVEGSAEAFAEIIYPELARKYSEWRNRLTDEQEDSVWAEMLPILDIEDEEIVGKYLFGGQDDVPDAAGYTIGYRIAKSYVGLHPEQAVSDWLLRDPHDFLQSSGYRLQAGD